MIIREALPTCSITVDAFIFYSSGSEFRITKVVKPPLPVLIGETFGC